MPLNCNIMKSISLKLDDVIFDETENLRLKMRIARNRYINEAIAYYNHFQKQALLEGKLQKESLLVREESISVLNEFEGIDYAD